VPRIADIPQPTVAGVGAVANGKLLVFGGDDGSLYARQFELKDRHPGFSKITYQFDPRTRRWSRFGVMPYSLATTGLAIWNHQFVIAGGEVRPGHRSALVMAGHLSTGGS
jgi:N-acetylneuraminic acid mutarotase